MKQYLTRFAQDIREHPAFWTVAATLSIIGGSAIGAAWWLV